MNDFSACRPAAIANERLMVAPWPGSPESKERSNTEALAFNNQALEGDGDTFS
jgi:hypothetical protein